MDHGRDDRLQRFPRLREVHAAVERLCDGDPATAMCYVIAATMVLSTIDAEAPGAEDAGLRRALRDAIHDLDVDLRCDADSNAAPLNADAPLPAPAGHGDAVGQDNNPAGRQPPPEAPEPFINFTDQQQTGAEAHSAARAAIRDHPNSPEGSAAVWKVFDSFRNPSTFRNLGNFIRQVHIHALLPAGATTAIPAEAPESLSRLKVFFERFLIYDAASVDTLGVLRNWHVWETYEAWAKLLEASSDANHAEYEWFHTRVAQLRSSSRTKKYARDDAFVKMIVRPYLLGPEARPAQRDREWEAVMGLGKRLKLLIDTFSPGILCLMRKTTVRDLHVEALADACRAYHRCDGSLRELCLQLYQCIVEPLKSMRDIDRAACARFLEISDWTAFDGNVRDLF